LRVEQVFISKYCKFNKKTLLLRWLIRLPDVFVCRWENGECRFGDRCNFAHGKDELRQLEPRLDPGAGRGRGRGRGVIDSAPQDGEDRSIGQGAGRNQPEHPSGGASQSVTPNDTDHSSWVASGCPVQGEHGWTQYQTDSGEKYYHNSDSNVTQWDVPADWTGPV